MTTPTQTPTGNANQRGHIHRNTNTVGHRTPVSHSLRQPLSNPITFADAASLPHFVAIRFRRPIVVCLPHTVTDLRSIPESHRNRNHVAKTHKNLNTIAHHNAFSHPVNEPFSHRVAVGNSEPVLYHIDVHFRDHLPVHFPFMVPYSHAYLDPQRNRDIIAERYTDTDADRHCERQARSFSIGWCWNAIA